MKKSKFNLFVKIFVVISCVFAVFACGYFSLDKIIIPRNFSHYGISSVKDLTNVFASLYGVPKESKIVKNGFEETDLESAVEKLQDVGYKIEDDGTIMQENISTFGKNVNSTMVLSDREVAAVSNVLVQSEILSQNLQNLNYIDAVNIEVIDFVITPDKESFNSETLSYD